MSFEDEVTVVGFRPSNNWRARFYTDDNHWSDLHFLSTIGKVDLFMDWFNSHTLDELGSQINLRDDIMDFTPLMIAIDSVELEYDELEQPYDVFEEFDDIRIQNQWATVDERLNFINMLVQFGAEPNPRIEEIQLEV